MANSMTGYGRHQGLYHGRDITVEIKAVNHRYFDFSCRAPRAYGFLEERLKNVQIVDHISTDTVAVGTKVILLDMEFDDKTEYRIASSGTGGDDDNVVTADSPVGQAIMGHAVGEVVDIKTPNGQTYQMKIIEIGK